MYTALYLNNNKIIAAVGKKNSRGIRVKKLYEAYAPEGSLVNGVVTDAEALTDCLRQFFRENRIPQNHVILVLNSTRLTIKMIRAPKMKPKETLEYVNREFAAMQQRQDNIVGYFVEGRDEKGILDLFALRMERDFLDVYDSIFKRLSIHLELVESGMGALVAAAGHFDYLCEKTCIIQILGETNLYSILLSKGRYIYSSSTRMFQEKGTAGFGLEVARTVSGMLQFAAAQKMEEPITDIFWGGFDVENEKICREHIEQISTTLAMASLLGGNWIKVAGRNEESLGVGAFAVAALGMPGAGNDMYHNYRKNSKRAVEKRNTVKMLAPVFTILGAGILAAVGVGAWYLSVKGYYDDLVSYNNSAAVLQVLEQYDTLSSENQMLTAAASELSTAQENLNSYPTFDSRIKQTLESNALGLVTVEISGYDAAAGAVSMQATASQMDDIHRFVERLEMLTDFAAVEYSGYTQSTQSGLWYCTVVVYLAAPAVEEGE